MRDYMSNLVRSPMEQFAVRVIVPTPGFLPVDMSLTNRSLAMLTSLALRLLVFYPAVIGHWLLKQPMINKSVQALSSSTGKVDQVEGRMYAGTLQAHVHPWMGTRLVDNRWDVRTRMVNEVVWTTIRSQLGRGKKGVEMVLSPLRRIFFDVLAWNCGGLVPMRFTPTRHLRVNRAMSFGVFLAMNAYGVRKHKEKMLSLLFPGDRPLWLSPLLVVLERVSYMFRPISLSVRLFANMAAGHRLLHILGGFVEKLRFHPEGTYKLLSLLPAAVVLAVILLESGVRALQRYVFLVLLSIYFRDRRDLHLGRKEEEDSTRRARQRQRETKEKNSRRVGYTLLCLCTPKERQDFR